MRATKTAIVEFTEQNVLTCRCGTCPVQSDSDCAHRGMERMREITGMTVSGEPTLDVESEDAYRQPQMTDAPGERGGYDIGTGSGRQARGAGNLPATDEIPGLYCASGEAACGDLAYEKRCVCPTCGVWQDHDLGSLRYCKDGPAARIG